MSFHTYLLLTLANKQHQQKVEHSTNVHADKLQTRKEKTHSFKKRLSPTTGESSCGNCIKATVLTYKLSLDSFPFKRQLVNYKAKKIILI